MKKAILIVGHGSRSTDAQDIFSEIVNMVTTKMPDKTVRGAHMELCSPSIESVIEDLVTNEEVTSISLVPYFLYKGIHIKEDIPNIIEDLSNKYPHIKLKLGRPIGAEELLADILVQRALEME